MFKILPVFVVLTSWMVFVCANWNVALDVQTNPEEARQIAARQAEAVVRVKGLLDNGDIQSIDLKARCVRIDPIVWRACTVEAKQRLVATLVIYFEERGYGGNEDRGINGDLDVFSDRNDTPLAHYCTWDGITICQ